MCPWLTQRMVLKWIPAEEEYRNALSQTGDDFKLLRPRWARGKFRIAKRELYLGGERARQCRDLGTVVQIVVCRVTVEPEICCQGWVEV